LNIVRRDSSDSGVYKDSHSFCSRSFLTSCRHALATTIKDIMSFDRSTRRQRTSFILHAWKETLRINAEPPLEIFIYNSIANFLFTACLIFFLINTLLDILWFVFPLKKFILREPHYNIIHFKQSQFLKL